MPKWKLDNVKVNNWNLKQLRGGLFFLILKNIIYENDLTVSYNILKV